MKHSPYSISKLSTYSQCPKKFYLNYIVKQKVPVSKNIALYKGSAIHKILEHKFDYTIDIETNEVFTEEEKTKAINIVKDFEKTELGQKYKKIMEVATSEEDFAFKIIDGKLELSNFWDKDSWCRGSADMFLKRGKQYVIFDYKSGKDKSNEDSFGIEQGMMYSIVGFIKHPDINNIKAIFCFVEHETEKIIIIQK